MNNKEYEFKEKSIDSIIYPDGQKVDIIHCEVKTKPYYKFIFLDYCEKEGNNGS